MYLYTLGHVCNVLVLVAYTCVVCTRSDVLVVLQQLYIYVRSGICTELCLDGVIVV